MHCVTRHNNSVVRIAKTLLTLVLFQNSKHDYSCVRTQLDDKQIAVRSIKVFHHTGIIHEAHRFKAQDIE